MSKQKEPPIKIDCVGGCGKSQFVRPTKITRNFTHIGCGRCEGWRQLHDSMMPVPDGMCLEHSYGVAGGFVGMRLRIATQEERASIGRARALLDRVQDTLRRE